MVLSVNGIAVTSFAAPEVWSTLVQVFIIALAVLAGNILRRKVKVLRRSLIPSALLGGLIILLFKIWADFNGVIDKRFMETVTYHALAIGFISMSLRPSKETSTVPHSHLPVPAIVMISRDGSMRLDLKHL